MQRIKHILWGLGLVWLGCSHALAQSVFITGDTAICSGNSTLLEAVTSGFGGNPTFTYQWSSNVPGCQSCDTTTVSPTSDQTYSVTVTNTGTLQTYTASLLVQVVPSSPTAILVVNTVEACIPFNYCFPIGLNGPPANHPTTIWTLDMGPASFSGTLQNVPDSICNDFTITSCTSNGTTYPVQLTLSNACGCIPASGGSIMAMTPPTADLGIQGSNTQFCTNSQVIFTNNSDPGCTNSNTTYLFDFGDGSDTTTSNLNAIAHAYNTPGNYDIVLTATNPCGSDSDTVNICVTGPPVANFTLSSTSGCSPYTTQAANLADTGFCGGTFEWLAGSPITPTSSTATNPAFMVSGATSSFISLEVTNICGSDTHTVPVTAIDEVNLSINALPDICDNGCQFPTASVNAGGTAATYDWLFPGGNPVSDTAIAPGPICYNSPGNYIISLEVSTVCDTAQATASFTVFAPPIVTLTANPDTICAGDTVMLTASGASSYSWCPNPAIFSTSGNIAWATFSQPTTFCVEGSDANGCTDTAYITVQVHNPLPVSLQNFQDVCEGNQMDTLPIPSPSNGYWSGPGLVDSILGILDVGLLQADTHLMVYSVIDATTGCPASDTLTYVVHPLPSGTILCDTACANWPVYFQGPASGIQTWFWEFGDGFGVAQGPNTSHTYIQTGTYTVTLSLTSNQGCFDTIQKPIFIDSIPTAQFTVDTGCVGDTTKFQSLSLGAPDLLIWYFGDGDTANPGQNLQEHVYDSAGTYTVTLVAANAANSCYDTATHLVVIPANTVPFLTADTACFEQLTHFQNLSAGPVDSLIWQFGDGSTDTAYHPDHLYGSPGTYTVTLTTFNPLGCSATFDTTILVHPLPDTTFTVDSVCFGEPVFFCAQDSQAVAYHWDLGDMGATDSVQKPQYVYSDTGLFQVQLIVTNAEGCSDTAYRTVEVWPNPVAAFGFDTICYGEATSFTDLSTDVIVAWNWNLNPAGTSTLQNPTTTFLNIPLATYGDTMKYPINLEVINQFGCIHDTTIELWVWPRPVPDFGFTSNPTCAMDTVCLSDSTLTIPGTTWHWDFDDGSTATNQNPCYAWPMAGTFTIEQFATNVHGCQDSISQDIIIRPLPEAGFFVDTVCHQEPSVFTDTSSSINPIVSWAWDFGDGNTAPNQNSINIYLTAGSYVATLLVTDIYGCQDTDTNIVVVEPNPVAGFTADTVCPGLPTNLFVSLGPFQYTWLLPPSNTLTSAGDTQYVFPTVSNYPTIFTISQVVTNSQGCSDTTIGQVWVDTMATASFTVQDTVCAGEPVLFQSTSSSSSGSITSSSWSFSNDTTATGTNAIIPFSNPGTYIATLNIETAQGCEDSTSRTIQVRSLPEPAFTHTGHCTGQPVVFTNQTPNGNQIASYFWDFGNGNTSILVHPPNQVFSSAGVYLVSLAAVTLSGCTDTLVQSITIDPAPQANFTAENRCLGRKVIFTDISQTFGQSTVSRLWDFDDNGATGTDSIEYHEFTNAQGYNVNLQIVVANGCQATITKNITIGDSIIADFILSLDTICEDAAFQAVDASEHFGVGIAQSLWDFGNGNGASGITVGHTYENGGDYLIQHIVTAQGSGCSDTTTDNIFIPSRPLANFTFHNACLGDSNIFIDQSSVVSGQIDSWLWFQGANLIATTPNFGKTYLQPGNYTVQLNVKSNFGCEDFRAQIIQIFPQPQARIGTLEECKGITFSDKTLISGDSVEFRQWALPDGRLESSASVYYSDTTNLNDSVSVRLIVETSHGCLDTAIERVSNHPIFQDRAGWIPPDSYCEGVSITFQDSTKLLHGEITRSWFDLGGAIPPINDRETTILFEDAGTYNPFIHFEYGNECQDSFRLNPISILRKPEVSCQLKIIHPEKPVLHVNLVGVASQDYHKAFFSANTLMQFPLYGDTIFEDASELLPNSGDHLLTIYSTDGQTGCIDTTGCSINLSCIPTLYLPNTFTPNSDGLNDQFKIVSHLDTDEFEDFKFEIFDRWGEKIFETSNITKGWNGTKNRDPFLAPQGVYVWKITFGGCPGKEATMAGQVNLIRSIE